MLDVSSIIRDAERRAIKARLTIDELCERAEINRATWQRWKAEKTTPNLRTLRRLEQVLATLGSK